MFIVSLSILLFSLLKNIKNLLIMLKIMYKNKINIIINEYYILKIILSIPKNNKILTYIKTITFKMITKNIFLFLF